MRRPVIGITAAHCLEELRTFPREYYVESIRSAGGTPILIPPVSTKEEALEVLAICQGLLLSGGGDISPLYLGEQPRPGLGDCFPERDESELLLAQTAMQLLKPILGICRGIQVLAIAGGGRIYQDLHLEAAQPLGHRQTAPRQHPWHEVEMVESRLLELLGEPRIRVNSLHHQAVSELPPGFLINARAPDGIIEGIEKAGTSFVLGVQWHPESMKDIYSQRLFGGFVESCRQV